MEQSGNLFYGTWESRNGETLTMRLLNGGDAHVFGSYLEGLSAATKSRWEPHGLNMSTAAEICSSLDPSECVRVVVTSMGQMGEKVVAYFIITLGVSDLDALRCSSAGYPVNQDEDCMFAPSVADAYQNQGVSSRAMPILIDGVRGLGRMRIILMGGVQATNDRAVHFYTKWGFETIGEFMTEVNNYSMVKTL